MLERSAIKEDVEWAIGAHRNFLKFQGIWAYEKETLWLKTKMNFRMWCLFISAYGFVALPQTIALVKVWGNVDLIGDNTMTNLGVLIAGMKLLKFWSKKKMVVTLLKKVEEDWYNLKTELERTIMIKYAKIPRIMLVCGMINIYSNIAFYYGSSLFFGLNLRLISKETDTNVDYFLPLQSYYFFNISTPYCYYPVVFTQVIGSLVAGLLYTCFDIIFGLLVLHACAQLENLDIRIKNLSTDSHSSFIIDLKYIVTRHRQLISFINQIEGLFSSVLLGLVVSFAAVFSILGFQIITGLFDDEMDVPILQTAFHILHMNYFLCLMFVYSWVGEILIIKNNALTLTLYCSDWVELSKNDRILLLILFVRIQKTTCITVGGIVPLSFDSFTQLIKTSMGYISGLLAVKNR